jgi:hypothetical protein
MSYKRRYVVRDDPMGNGRQEQWQTREMSDPHFSRLPLYLSLIRHRVLTYFVP